MPQVGLAGTWIQPLSPNPPSTCPCDPGPAGMPCCLGQCPKDFPLYETMEGGPGFWVGELPTTKVKWIINNANTCYRGGSNSYNAWTNRLESETYNDFLSTKSNA